MATMRPNQARAVSRYVRVSPRKARLVADLVRGKPVEEAFDIIDLSDKAAAIHVGKTVHSAVANAERNHNLSRNRLFVADIRVDDGPTMKRYRPRAYGRATTVRKRTSHISVIVEEKGGRS